MRVDAPESPCSSETSAAVLLPTARVEPQISRGNEHPGAVVGPCPGSRSLSRCCQATAADGGETAPSPGCGGAGSGLAATHPISVNNSCAHQGLFLFSAHA